MFVCVHSKLQIVSCYVMQILWIGMVPNPNLCEESVICAIVDFYNIL